MKTLMVLACNAVLLRVDGCRNIGRIARDQLGVSDAEMAEVMKVAFMMGGVPALNTICNAFPEYIRE